MTSDEQIQLNAIAKAVSEEQVGPQQELHRLENGTDTSMGDKEEEAEDTGGITGDWMNLALLLLLYTLQGVPLGLSAAMQMILQKRGASYQTQAQFSFRSWPFTLKLLWAPIVDACFFERFGRRKSWIVPVQLLIGLSLLGMSFFIEGWLGDEDNAPQINILTGVFFFLIFLAATQDICTDGWSLTLLRRCNLGYASICNSIGHSVASFFGYAIFISLESADFCNTWLRSEPKDVGIVTLEG